MDFTPLTFTEDYDDRLVKGLAGETIETSYGEAARARFVESWERAPTMSLIRLYQLREKGVESEEELYKKYFVSGVPEDAEVGISKEDWEQSIHYREGLEYRDNMTESQAGLLAELNDAEEYRQEVNQRANLTTLQKGSLLGVDLVAQAVDPANYALAFTPVVGQVRFAGLIARFGKTSARLMTGAVEGAVGNALVEPIIYMSASQQQADYDLYDSLVAVGIGGVFGSGLHAGLGKVGDKLGISNIARDKSLQTAIHQAFADRNIKIDPILAADMGMPISRTDIELPKHVDTDELASDQIDVLVGEAGDDIITKRASDDLKADMDDLYQMNKNGVITDEQYLIFKDEMELVKVENEALGEAMDALSNCLVRS